MYAPEKTIFSTVEIVDFTGIEAGSAKNGLFSQSSMGLLKIMNALAVVVRNFPNEILDTLIGKPDRISDLKTITSELSLSDLIIAEKRIERIEADYKRGKKTPILEKEEKLLKTIVDLLYQGINIRDVSLSNEEKKIISGFQFLSQKPILIIINSDEKYYGKNTELIGALNKDFPVIEFAGLFEMELARMNESEAKAFMEDMGIKESARARLTTKAFNVLGLISFFTVGKDEVRAWTVKKGDNAITAAGAIHSDLAKGFIRAECFSYQDLISCGSEKGIKEKGRFRLEGKDYIVQDGDILSIRFN
jgi:GTP-binding protein YchF